MGEQTAKFFVDSGGAPICLDARCPQVEAVKKAYEAYQAEAEFTDPPRALDTQIAKAPFLTSKEHDQLLKGLRKANFFEKMKFDTERQRYNNF